MPENMRQAFLPYPRFLIHGYWNDERRRIGLRCLDRFAVLRWFSVFIAIFGQDKNEHAVWTVFRFRFRTITRERW